MIPPLLMQSRGKLPDPFLKTRPLFLGISHTPKDTRRDTPTVSTRARVLPRPSSYTGDLRISFLQLRRQKMMQQPAAASPDHAPGAKNEPRSQLVTVFDLARFEGVSKSTISRYLSRYDHLVVRTGQSCSSFLKIVWMTSGLIAENGPTQGQHEALGQHVALLTIEVVWYYRRLMNRPAHSVTRQLGYDRKTVTPNFDSNRSTNLIHQVACDRNTHGLLKCSFDAMT